MTHTYIGKYINGSGKAHKCTRKHVEFFKCKVFGTFNIKMPQDFDIFKFKPARTNGINTYWLVKINDKYGWALRWQGSNQQLNVLEIYTKEKLPDEYKTGDIKIQILEPMDELAVKDWAKDLYWFQSFSWSPKRSDSALIWRAINNCIDWKDKRVLDIGCNYGYFSCKASRAGSIVTAFDINKKSLQMAEHIKNHIEMEDFDIVNKDDEKNYDVILYLSVHHQIDPSYADLQNTLERYKKRCKDLFIELILPPMFGKGMAESTLDQIVGGRTLEKYHHLVRGTRKIYHIKGYL